MPLKKLTTASAMFCLCVACSYSHESGRQFDAAYVEQIKSGVTTKNDVTNHLGNPLLKSVKYGKEEWQYWWSQATTSQTAKSFIPIVGILYNKTDTASSAVSIQFDGDLVAACEFQQSTGKGSANSFDLGQTGGGSKVVTRCGDK